MGAIFKKHLKIALQSNSNIYLLVGMIFQIKYEKLFLICVGLLRFVLN